MPGWQPFTKSDPALPMPAAVKASVSSLSDPYGLKRLTTSEVKTAQGVMRLAHKIIGEGLPQPANLETKKIEGPSYAAQRCRSIDPNAYRTRVPFHRVQSPHEARKRRPPGWTDCRFVLPKLVLEGLRALTIELTHQQQNSDWPGERRRYPATKNFHLTAALNDYFKKLGFEQFCVEEQKPLKASRVRRFVAPNS